MVTIKFKTEKDKADGYYLLAIKGTVRSLPDGIFEINDQMIEILNKEGIKFDIIKESDLDENKKIRNTPAIVV